MSINVDFQHHFSFFAGFYRLKWLWMLLNIDFEWIFRCFLSKILKFSPEKTKFSRQNLKIYQNQLEHAIFYSEFQYFSRKSRWVPRDLVKIRELAITNQPIFFGNLDRQSTFITVTSYIFHKMLTSFSGSYSAFDFLKFRILA